MEACPKHHLSASPRGRVGFPFTLYENQGQSFKSRSNPKHQFGGGGNLHVLRSWPGVFSFERDHFSGGNPCKTDLTLQGHARVCSFKMDHFSGAYYVSGQHGNLNFGFSTRPQCITPQETNTNSADRSVNPLDQLLFSLMWRFRCVAASCRALSSCS